MLGTYLNICRIKNLEFKYCNMFFVWQFLKNATDFKQSCLAFVAHYNIYVKKFQYDNSILKFLIRVGLVVRLITYKTLFVNISLQIHR